MPAKDVEVARVTTIVSAFSNKSVPAFVKGFESLADQDKNITFAPAFAKVPAGAERPTNRHVGHFLNKQLERNENSVEVRCFAVGSSRTAHVL